MLDWLLNEPLKVGEAAPEFELRAHGGGTVRLSLLRGKNVVLVFYPGDDTPTCTKQLCALRDEWPNLQAHNAVAFGINPRNAQSHAKFVSKFAFPFPLLVDEGGRVAKLYHAGGLLVRRTVYGIDGEGVIRFAQRGNPAPGEVLAALKV